MVAKRLVKKNYTDTRVEIRRSGLGYRALIDGKSYIVSNLSNNGFAIQSKKRPKRVVVAQMFFGDRCVRQCIAVHVWGRNGIHGYQFKNKVKILHF